MKYLVGRWIFEMSRITMLLMHKKFCTCPSNSQW